MKVVNLRVMTNEFGKVPTPKTLSKIIRDVEATKGALNPYTIIGQKIITHLKRNFVFPFLQPNVVNPLEFGEEQEFYIQRDGLENKFSKARVREAMGMDEPVGLKLCLDQADMPFFVRYDELSTEIATIDYRVSDFESFKRFIPKLVRDMSFLRPMKRQEIEREYNPTRKFKKGDIVLVYGQRYGKIALVTGFGTKTLARFNSPEGFHTQQIGVDSTVLMASDGHYNTSASYFQDSKDLKWGEPLLPGQQPKMGSAYFLIGHSNYRNEQTILGQVEIIGFDVNCATVMPHTFDEKEIFPWGNIRELAIPVSELVYLGSIDEIKRGTNIYSRFFANDIEVMNCIRDVTEKEIDNPYVAGLVAFCDLTKYQKIYQDLLECSEVPHELVAPQFVSILTSNGIEGIERLAKISNRDISKVSSELLAADVKEAKRILESGKKRYGSLVGRLQEITRNHTNFGSIEELLQFASPQINLYQMPRDGAYTLAYVCEFETLSKSKNDDEPKSNSAGTNLRSFNDIETGELKKLGIDPNLYLEIIKNIVNKKRFAEEAERYHLHEAEFLSLHDIPDEFTIDENGNLHCLIGVCYKILCKENSVRYGRDERFVMTYPGLQPIDSQFRLYPFAASFQLDFLIKILMRIKQNVEFEGKSKFFSKCKNAISEVTEKPVDKDEFYLHESGSFNDRLVHIQQFYDGIKKITQNPEVKNKIVLDLLGEEPLLLEAFYDFENLQKMIAIRDHYWRGRLQEKMEYLKQFGYWRNLSRTGFADEFYEALSEVDMYHRGFPHSENEVWGVSRAKSSGFRSLWPEASKLGLCASRQADALLVGIQQQVKQLSAGIGRADVVGLLTDSKDYKKR